MMQIAEQVTKYHPDKICDIVSDAIVDACLEQDPFSRVAVETIGGHGSLVLIGEVTTKAEVDFGSIARKTYFDLVGKDIGVLANIVKQSPEIQAKVDNGGAGDQGLMIGYACKDNKTFMPQEVYLAKKLLEGFEADGKSQVVMNDERVENVVLSVQGKNQDELEKRVREVVGDVPMFCNNIGDFTIGGFDADSGCTGRKIVVDAYGGRVPVGGGAFSGKDPTKVDRSAAYMARFIALDYLKGEQECGFDEILVKIGYVIGGEQPLMLQIYGGKDRVPLVPANYDCRPEAIIERFDLRKPIYKDTAERGHFGRDLPWERIGV